MTARHEPAHYFALWQRATSEVNMESKEKAQGAEIRAYRVADFCKRLGISASTFFKYQRAGKIRTIRIGGRVLIPHDEATRIASEGLR